MNRRQLAIRPGDRVRIVFGSLANCRGTVLRLSDRHRCVMRIDDPSSGERSAGESSGPRIILPADELERLN